LIAAALLASSAKASDVANFPLPYNASGPIVGSPHDWTGVYLGAQAGYGWGQSSGTQNAGGTFFPVVPYAIDPAGAFAGGHVGFNYQTGALVLGAEADLEASNLEGSTAFSAFDQTYVFNVKADTLASVRGRAGWARDQLMLYGTAGVAWGHVTSPPLVSLDGWRTGWTGGGRHRTCPAAQLVGEGGIPLHGSGAGELFRSHPQFDRRQYPSLPRHPVCRKPQIRRHPVSSCAAGGR
jgi:outer membrane immunogenic protein